MCSFCTNDSIKQEIFYSKNGEEITMFLCTECEALNQSLTMDVYTEEFQEQVEEMAESLFGGY